METKPFIKKVQTFLYVIFGALLLAVIIGMFVDYPKQIDQALSNILIVCLGLVLLFKAYQIRSKDGKFAMIYLITGIVMILVAFLSLAFVKIIAVVGLVAYLLTTGKVQKMINKKEDNSQS
ncbi:MAG: hypothetical protein PHY99_10380 [Bacteroidales bacterium]|nr:hypothetical protein [Bacteroidales bacterium]